MSRFYNYPEAESLQSDDVFLIDGETDGTRKIPADKMADFFGEQVPTDKTLAVSNKAADAKVVGDEIGELKSALKDMEPGLSDEAKVALLNCFQHVAWIDEHGQDYYDALEDALYADKTLTAISAAFNQGQNKIYEDDALDTLKQYLTVTAHYTDGTSSTISEYTLTGALKAGTSVITVTYSGETTTFNVSVTAATAPLLYNWDFTKSLTDTVVGAVADTTATRGSNGLIFSSANKYLDLGTVYSRDRTYEIDIDYIGTPDPASMAYRRIFAFGENGTNTSANTTALIVAMSDYRPGWYWYIGASWDSDAIGSAVSTIDSYNYFDGKTMKIYIDSSGYGHVYAKTIGADDSTYVKVGVSHAALADYNTSNAHIYMGGVSDRLASSRIKAYRIYGGAK